MMGGCLSTTPLIYFDDDQDIPQYDGNISLSSTDSSETSDYVSSSNPIPVIITSERVPKSEQLRGPPNNIVINHSSKKVLTANQLPVVVNLNPRRVYNKKEEFKTMMEQLEVDICFMSESWDREKVGLEKVIKMDNYQIIKNVVQRTGKGGKPALIIKKD